MRRRPGRGGFTLVELVVVLAIMAMGAALVLPSLSGPLESARFRQGGAELKAAMTQARARAAASGRIRAVRIDLDRGEYGIPADNVGRALPEGVRVASVSAPGVKVERGVVDVRFFPDGSADDAEVVLADGADSRITLRVDPLTGVVEAGA
jgi:general secretion pathway protein H